MGCSSSASVMHDDLEDTSLTRVIFTDWHVVFQIDSIPSTSQGALSIWGTPTGTRVCAGCRWTTVRRAFRSIQGLGFGLAGKDGRLHLSMHKYTVMRYVC